MGKKVFYTNKTKTIQYPGGVAVRPGDTRPVDEDFLPKAKEPFDAVEFLEGGVNELKKLVNLLSDAELAAVIQAELEGKNRSSLLDRLNAEVEEREFEAAQKVKFDELNALDDDDLQLKLLDESIGEEEKELVESILNSRGE